MPLQGAITRLLGFLGTHRQHVFLHRSAGHGHKADYKDGGGFFTWGKMLLT